MIMLAGLTFLRLKIFRWAKISTRVPVLNALSSLLSYLFSLRIQHYCLLKEVKVKDQNNMKLLVYARLGGMVNLVRPTPRTIENNFSKKVLLVTP
jgi:hypothetical protein